MSLFFKPILFRYTIEDENLPTVKPLLLNKTMQPFALLLFQSPVAKALPNEKKSWDQIWILGVWQVHQPEAKGNTGRLRQAVWASCPERKKKGGPALLSGAEWPWVLEKITGL